MCDKMRLARLARGHVVDASRSREMRGPETDEWAGLTAPPEAARPVQPIVAQQRTHASIYAQPTYIVP